MIELVKKKTQIVLTGDENNVNLDTPTHLVVADVDKAYVDSQDKAMKEYADAQHVEMVRDLEAGINEAMSIAKGAARSEVYDNYEAMVAALNTADKDFLKVPDHVYVRTIGVPDLWVSQKLDNHNAWVYTTDEAIADEIAQGSPVHIGYWVFSMLETQKADLSNLATKEQVPHIETTLKENGAYTLTITQGVE